MNLGGRVNTWMPSPIMVVDNKVNHVKMFQDKGGGSGSVYTGVDCLFARGQPEVRTVNSVGTVGG
jgi:hypothetical protein